MELGGLINHLGPLVIVCGPVIRGPVAHGLLLAERVEDGPHGVIHSFCHSAIYIVFDIRRVSIVLDIRPVCIVLHIRARE